MKLENNTNIETQKIREFIKFSKPSGVSKFHITFKTSGWGISGRAYTGRNKILISVGKSDYPYVYKAGRCCRGYLSYIVLNQDEDILGIIAHELRHLWQSKHRKGYRVHGSRGVYSERDADAYAIRKIREYRKLNRVSKLDSFNTVRENG